MSVVTKPQTTRDLRDEPVSGVTIIIPAFNEESGVCQTIERVRRVMSAEPHPFEIVVVDDGSTDRTAEEARRAGAEVIRFPNNRGYGSALRAGILAAQSPFVAIIDADGTYPEESIPLLLARADSSDMVVGARKPDSASIPWARRPAKRFLTWLASYLAGRTIPDLNSGLRVYRRSAIIPYLGIMPPGFSFTTTSTLALLCNHHRVEYVPIEYRTRIGSSKIRPRHLMDFTILVLRTVVLFNPLKIFLPLGTLLFLLGMVKLIYDIFLWNLSESAVMAFLSAILIWSVGLLADMIARIHLRPPLETSR